MCTCAYCSKLYPVTIQDAFACGFPSLCEGAKGALGGVVAVNRHGFVPVNATGPLINEREWTRMLMGDIPQHALGLIRTVNEVRRAQGTLG